MKSKTLEQRFWNKVEKTESCWLWRGAKRDGGYGTFKIPKGPRLAHRVSYELLIGSIPTNTEIRHTCDNRACVNPDHLRLLSWPERFWAFVQKTPTCWLWTGNTHKKGYGTCECPDGKIRKAHRIAWQLLRGPIPEGLTIDHLCRVRNCLNPDHLEPVTMAVNNDRGESSSAKNKRKTHCPKGHELSLENALPADRQRGWRRCRICAIEYARQATARRSGKKSLTSFLETF